MTGEQKPGGLEVVAKVVSAFGDPEAFGERDIEVVADMSRIPYETRLTPAEPAEARIRELERQLSEWPQTMRFCEAQWAEERGFMIDRYTAAEAKLARAVEGLERIAHGSTYFSAGDMRDEARQTLAALQQGTQHQ